MKDRRWVGGLTSTFLVLFILGACSASAQLTSITNTTHTPASPRAGQDVFIETQTSPTGSAVEAAIEAATKAGAKRAVRVT